MTALDGSEDVREAVRSRYAAVAVSRGSGGAAACRGDGDACVAAPAATGGGRGAEGRAVSAFVPARCPLPQGR